MSLRAAILAACALALAACAFPPWIDAPPKQDPCGGCAGFCDSLNICEPSPVGGSCDPSGLGQACVTGATCIGGTCSQTCSGPACGCENKRCAGRCTSGTCVGADLGEGCDPGGEGPACASGSCVSGTCRNSEPAPPVELADYLGTVRSLYCDYLVRCGRWPASLRDGCAEALFPSTPVFDSDAEAVRLAQAGELAYDREAAGDCLHAFASIACGKAYPDSCDRIFTGRGAADDHCAAASACGRGFFCARNDVTGLRCDGVCVARAAEGADCAQTPCLEGLACLDEGADPSTPVKRCRARTPPAGLGQACGNGPQPCLGDLYCATDDTCQARRAQNASCDSAYGCASGLVCALVDNRTRAVCLPARALGESCTSDQQCTPLTMQVAVAACQGGRCTRLPASGPCVDDPYLRNRCDPERASCGDDGQCHPLASADEACARQEDCGGALTSLVCSFGACRTPLACE